jgi:hypothetical protein
MPNFCEASGGCNFRAVGTDIVVSGWPFGAEAGFGVAALLCRPKNMTGLININ